MVTANAGTSIVIVIWLLNIIMSCKGIKKEIEIAASNRMPFAMLTIVTVMRATSVMQMMLQVINVDIVVAARIVVI